MQSQTKQAIFIIWAVLATVAAMVFAVVALWLFLLRTGDLARTENRLAVQTAEQPPVRPNASASPFANVKEADIPGRYKFSEGGEELGTMTLNADHTFINKDGTTFKRYHWELSADGLILRWQRVRSKFSIMEKPGVYVAPARNGRDQRLEKID